MKTTITFTGSYITCKVYDNSNLISSFPYVIDYNKNQQHKIKLIVDTGERSTIYVNGVSKVEGDGPYYETAIVDLSENKYMKTINITRSNSTDVASGRSYDFNYSVDTIPQDPEPDPEPPAPEPDPDPIFVNSIASVDNQYIKTNILPSMNHVIELEVKMNNLSDAGVIYGVRQAMGGVQTSLLKYNSDNTFIIQSTNGYKIFGSFNRSEWIKIKVDYPNKQVSINGITTKLTQFVFGKITNPYYIFAFDKLGSIEFPAIMSLKSFKVTENGNDVIADYKPCINSKTKQPALYDVVSKQYFYNKGTGEFTYEEFPSFKFSKVTQLTIPEGKVKQIAIGGQIVWKAVPQGINWLGYTGNASGSNNYGDIKFLLNGVDIKDGDVITKDDVFAVRDSQPDEGEYETKRGYIQLNGKTITVVTGGSTETVPITIPEGSKTIRAEIAKRFSPSGVYKYYTTDIKLFTE